MNGRGERQINGFENLEQLIDGLVKVLARDSQVVYAYFYGSVISEPRGNDIDITVYPYHMAEPSSLALNPKIDMHNETGVP